MDLAAEPYVQQVAQVPARGRHILAYYDAETIVVYQAYRPSTAHYALEHGALGGPHFSYNRMSWIKPSFLWMMYRSGWATKPGQEMVLALRLRRAFFERVLEAAVLTSFDELNYASPAEWQRAMRTATVRVQWDPDRLPTCGRCGGRRAIQLGLRGPILEDYGRREIVEVLDMTPFVREQRSHTVPPYANLVVPQQRLYVPASPLACRRVRLCESSA
jgi:hypothetical protein